MPHKIFLRAEKHLLQCDAIKTHICVGTMSCWSRLFLANRRISDHAKGMIRRFIQILALCCASLTGFVIWQDLNSPFNASMALGNIWYGAHPGSLQVSEAIISRYIDPCGLIIALNCTPFLWHPLIATLLGWPAGLVGFVLTGILWFFGRPNQRYGRASQRVMNR